MSKSTWFDLARHDEGDPNTDPNPAGDPPAGDPADDGTAALGDKGKQAIDRMKAERTAAKAQAAAEKQRADELAARVAEFEDRDKSDLDKATAKAEAAATRAEAATARAVRAEVKALATSTFADPTDATALLDLAKYTDSTGEIDTAAIEADLAALLAAKPHLARPADRRAPAPDGAQGGRLPAGAADFRTASREDVAAELAKYSYRQRS